MPLSFPPSLGNGNSHLPSLSLSSNLWLDHFCSNRISPPSFDVHPLGNFLFKMQSSKIIPITSSLSSTQLKQSNLSRRGRTFSGNTLRYVTSRNCHRRSPPHTLDICTSPIMTTSNGDGYCVVSISNTQGSTCSNTSKGILDNTKITGTNLHRNINSSSKANFKQVYTMVGSYSSAKLAPPLVGASVVDYERRRTLQDQNIWYTVQIYPCPITFPNRARSEPRAPIPRKSYKVFRKFEDMVNFSVRLEDEFPWLKSGHDTALKTVRYRWVFGSLPHNCTVCDCFVLTRRICFATSLVGPLRVRQSSR